MVVCLSHEYAGDPLFSCYAIDPSSGQELDLEINLSLNEEEIRCAFANEEDYAANMVEVFQGVFAIGKSLSFERERRKVVERTLKECVAKLGFSADHTLTSEDVLTLSKCLAVRMEPFLRHVASGRRRVVQESSRNAGRPK